jgi:hypothetical protein
MNEEQQSLCKRYSARFMPVNEILKVGISEGALRGDFPLHGLRHPPESGTTGWFIWSGDYSGHEDFFQPLLAYHLACDCPAALPYLGLSPGWRFLVGPEYEDVWFDSTLLDV